MAKEICISSTPHETRLAILEDDQLAEIYYERENEYTLAGSIYNGRVTRVLPGMQSAFVDLGLERDAFLYVTDFLEMEESEDSDEVEKAAVTGSTQAPREVRGGDRAQRPQEGRGGRDQGRDQAREPARDQERGGRDRRPLTVEPQAEPDVASQFAPSMPPPEAAEEGDESNEPGAKRWRGRRRRRGRGPGGSVADPVETEASAETFLEPFVEPAPREPEIQATGGGEQRSSSPRESGRESREGRGARESGREGREGGRGARESGRESRESRDSSRETSRDNSESGRESGRESRGERTPAPFVLPGESLSKYGGDPAPSSSAPAQTAKPTRPAPTFKPSSLIEAPLQWDGSGLLPGESLARHRTRPAQPMAEPEGTFSDAEQIASPQTEAHEHTRPQYEMEGHATESTHSGNPMAHFEVVEEDLYPEEPSPEASEVQLPSTTDEYSEHGSGPADDEDDRSASHNVDPLPPSEFRLFGLGGGKKKKDEGEHPSEYPRPVMIPSDPAASSGPTSPRSLSAFAPGAGVVEEETIEEEEFDSPGHHHKTDEHDLDEYEEEEKLHGIRTGELGEMLQEAHLDHRIQLNFDEKGGDSDEEFDSDDEDETGEEPAQAEGAPAADPGRRERGGRGRRGTREPQRGGNRRGGPSRRSAQTSDLPIISDLLKPGQEILVQIAKEPIAKKGARITSHIALPGRFLVFMPTVTHVGVSRKIASDDERQRLKRILTSERGDAPGGFIVRTAAEGASEEELRADLRFLIHLWDEVKQRSENSKAPALIYHDLSLIERILRDQVSENFSSIWVDSQDDYERIVRFLNRFSPNLVRRVKLYTKETPLFEHFGIQDEISKALRSKVWLKSGGSIVINQTEALVAIDINTGKYVGKTARLEDTIVKTNLDAIPEIVRQIRLRDLGGIIIIDFIDMDERKNRFKVMAALEEALKNDRAPTKVLQFNDFGLVAITRKRVKQSLERTLSVPCPTCQATGMVKSPATVCNEIYSELRKMRKHFENADVLVRVNPETVKVLKANNARWITEFEDLIGKNILIKSDAALHPEQFDIQG